MSIKEKSLTIRPGKYNEYFPTLTRVDEQALGWPTFTPTGAQKELFLQSGMSIALAQTIRDTFAKGATVEELIMFAGVANKYQLDPMTGEIYFIKYAKKKVVTIKDEGQFIFYDYQNAVGAIVVGYKGYMKHAHLQGDYVGCPGDIICENDEFKVAWGVNENGIPRITKLTHEYGLKDRGKIHAAWRCAIRNINGKPQAEYFIAYLDEHGKKYDKNGEEKWKSDIWEVNPSTQIKKCAISHVLRVAYGMTDTTVEEDLVKPAQLGDRRGDSYPDERFKHDADRMQTAATIGELNAISDELNAWILTPEMKEAFTEVYTAAKKILNQNKPEPKKEKAESVKYDNPTITPEFMAQRLKLDLNEKIPDSPDKRYTTAGNRLVDQVTRKAYAFNEDGSFATKGLPGRKPVVEQEKADPEPKKKNTALLKSLIKQVTEFEQDFESTILDSYNVKSVDELSDDEVTATEELIRSILSGK